MRDESDLNGTDGHKKTQTSSDILGKVEVEYVDMDDNILAPGKVRIFLFKLVARARVQAHL